jgi:purine-binding chemotaxis protein CheW
MAAQAALNLHQTKDKAGKYLTFMLGDEYYGLEIQKVREIVAMMHITPVPRTQPFIRGVVNLRGHVIPVIDLRLKLDLPPTEPNKLTCIIVVELRHNKIGMIVDKVCDVMNIADTEIDEPLSFGMELDTDFLLGIGKAGDRVTILLDVDKVLTSDEMEMLEKYS